MTTILLVGWLVLIVASYKGAVMMLDKANEL